MRRLSRISFISAYAVVIFSSSASALSAAHSFTGGALTGMGTDGIVLGNGTRLNVAGLGPGFQFEVAITLDNSVGDGISSVFTHLQYDESVMKLVNGFADMSAFPPEPGFATVNTLINFGPPADVLGQPPGTASGISVGVNNPHVGDGVYTWASSGVVAVAIFEFVGGNSYDGEIRHVDTGQTTFNGVQQSPTFSPRSIQLVFMPEPSAALLIGLGLGGLALSGRRRA